MPNPLHTPWSDEELEVLRDIYSRWPRDFSALADRTVQSIEQKAHRLGIARRDLIPPVYDHVAPVEWAWLAGFFDGEGTAYLNRRERPNRKAAQIQALVHVCNTHLPTMEWIRHTWPGGTWGVRPVGSDGGGALAGRKKVLYTYRWSRKGTVNEVLTGMYPYLITKREAADLILTRFSALT